MLNYGPAVLIIFSVFLSVFIGILMNRRDVIALKDDINRQFGEVNHRLTRLEGDYREFYGMEKKLEGRVDELSRR